jgi:hypothetical protein
MAGDVVGDLGDDAGLVATAEFEDQSGTGHAEGYCVSEVRASIIARRPIRGGVLGQVEGGCG